MIQAGADRSAPAAPAIPVVLLRATAAETPGAGLKVAGITVVDRALKQLARQGYSVVLATDGTCPLPSPLPAGVQVREINDPAEVETLRSVLGSPPVIAADVVRPSNRTVEGGIRVVDKPSRRKAEDAVFAELLRGDLGVVARFLNKPLSFRITRYLLCPLPVTPNQVTLSAAVIGVLGGILIASGRYELMLAGFLLAHLQSVLDGCDGELARVRFQQSPIGEWLDTVVDDVLNVVLIAALGVGLWRGTGSSQSLVLAGVACAMLVFYNAVAYGALVRQGEGGEVLKVRWWFNRGADLKDLYGGKQGGHARLVIALGRRDFFLLAWVICAAFGWTRFILIYALIIASVNFVVAFGQLVWRRGRA